MNKFIKAAIAGAAGVSLLLGGAGTFALWNSSVTTDGGQISSGTLAITKTTTGTWTNTPNDGSAGAVTIANFKASPGDTLTFTQTLNVTAIGDNLKAELTVDPASIVVPTTGNTTANTALKTDLLTGMTVRVTGPANVNQVGATNVYNVTHAPAAETVTVVVTLPFPRGTGVDNTTQTGAVTLNALSFNLTQI